MKNPDGILDELDNSLTDAKVLTNRKFKAYIKYSFDFSHVNNRNYRDTVMQRLLEYHDMKDLTNFLIKAKGEGEMEVMWIVKSDTAIDPVEILKLGSTREEIDLIDAWISYISPIIGPSCSKSGGCNAITLITSSFRLYTILDKFKLAMKNEALNSNAIMLLHEMFDEWALEENTFNAVNQVLQNYEGEDSEKILVDAFADYCKNRHISRVT